MSKRTSILIVFLLLLTGFFVYIAILQNKSQKTTQMKNTAMQVTPTKKPIPAFTTLALSPNPLQLSGKTGSISVLIDTHGDKNKVTAVQLELSYDPAKLTGVTIKPGTFLENAAPLINTIDTKSGKITYALAISPSGKGKSGQGTVATITFQSLLSTGMKTEFTLLPKTLITSEGVSDSVFLKGSSTTISQ